MDGLTRRQMFKAVAVTAGAVTLGTSVRIAGAAPATEIRVLSINTWPQRNERVGRTEDGRRHRHRRPCQRGAAHRIQQHRNELGGEHSDQRRHQVPCGHRRRLRHPLAVPDLGVVQPGLDDQDGHHRRRSAPTVSRSRRTRSPPPAPHNVVARYPGTPGMSGSVAPEFPVVVTAAPATDVRTTTTLDPVGTAQPGRQPPWAIRCRWSTVRQRLRILTGEPCSRPAPRGGLPARGGRTGHRFARGQFPLRPGADPQVVVGTERGQQQIDERGEQWLRDQHHRGR